MSTASNEKYRKISPLLKISNISKVFDNNTIALSNMSLKIYPGEFITFVGPSGCGKSTVFKIIAGLIQPTNGKVEMESDESNELHQLDIGFVFQNATLLPWKSVLDNVSLPLELKGTVKKERHHLAEEAIELVGLTGYEKSLPHELSGGMQMRVSIARSLISKPKLLLMDEPFGALDEITRQKMHYELMGIWEKTHMTVLFITHNVFESVFLSNRVAVMSPRPGRITDVFEIQGYTRDEKFRSSPEFSQLVGRVSAGLKH